MSIINTNDQLKAAVEAGTIGKSKAVAVSYHARMSGRMGYADCSRAEVWSPFFKADPDAAWYCYGAKHFSAGQNWRESIEEAKRWASKKYGIKKWARNSFGGFVTAIVNEKHPIPKRDDERRAVR